MPFGEPGAYWILLGPDVQFRRTAYDLDQAAARIRATPYPQAEAFAARNVAKPPSEQEVLDAFARVAVEIVVRLKPDTTHATSTVRSPASAAARSTCRRAASAP